MFRFRQKKSGKKRPEPEGRNGALHFAAPGSGMPGPDLPNASEALNVLIAPLIDLLGPQRRTVSSYQNALDIGRECWNLHVKHDGQDDFEAALDRCCGGFVDEQAPATEVRKVLQFFIDRKRALFPDDDRVVVDARAVDTGGRIQSLVTWARFAKVH